MRPALRWPRGRWRRWSSTAGGKAVARPYERRRPQDFGLSRRTTDGFARSVRSKKDDAQSAVRSPDATHPASEVAQAIPDHAPWAPKRRPRAQLCPELFQADAAPVPISRSSAAADDQRELPCFQKRSTCCRQPAVSCWYRSVSLCPCSSSRRPLAIFLTR